MKGLELSRAYYEEYGAPMLKEKFSEYEGLIAVGLVGSGSECFGYDDKMSEDHDFEPGFCLFLPDESLVDSKVEFMLERAYAKLPREFLGYSRSLLAPVGKQRRGVIRISDFYGAAIGAEDGELSVNAWLTIPDYALAEATNGEVFRDDLGQFSKIRNSLLNMPRDVLLKRLAGNLLMMAQAGQYNYQRCILREETGAAQLAAIEFVKSTLSVIFLLNGRYMPYYKWSFRALCELERLSYLAQTLEYIISSDNSPKNSKDKYELIEQVSSIIIDELQKRSLTEAICGDLEKHAYSVNDGIADINIRNMNIFSAV